MNPPIITLSPICSANFCCTIEKQSANTSDHEHAPEKVRLNGRINLFFHCGALVISGNFRKQSVACTGARTSHIEVAFTRSLPRGSRKIFGDQLRPPSAGFDLWRKWTPIDTKVKQEDATTDDADPSLPITEILNTGKEELRKGISEREGKGAQGSAERVGRRVSLKLGNGVLGLLRSCFPYLNLRKVTGLRNRSRSAPQDFAHLRSRPCPGAHR